MTSRRDQIIEQQLPALRAAARKFSRQNAHFRRLYDDIYSAGVVKLVEVVDRFLVKGTPFDKRFQNYLRISWTTAFIDLIRTENVIQSPRTVDVTRCAFVAEGPDGHPKTARIQYQQARYHRNVGDDSDGNSIKVLDKLGRQGDFSFSVDSLCRDDVDKKLIKLMTVEGALSIGTIAEMLGLSPGTVRRRLRRIKQELKSHD